MAWSGNNDSINQFTPRNYMYGSFVFLLDEITQDTCFSLLGDITNYVMQDRNPAEECTLDFIINSPGGDVSTMTTILGLINIAKLNGICVRSYVLGTAGSAASLIAVHADDRFMSKLSYHFIHFGTHVSVTQKASEIEKVYLQTKQYAKSMDALYLEASNGKLTPAVLSELQKDERGYLNAEECVKYGLCDKVIEDDLTEMLTRRKEEKQTIDEFIAYKKQLKTKNKKATKKGD